MIWLRLLMASRPLWQLGILLLYSFAAQTAWEKAAIGSCGALLLATNGLIAISFPNPAWRLVERTTLLLEGTSIAVLEIMLLHLWSLGPATLLLLPTLVTYLWLFHDDSWQWLIAFIMGIIYCWHFRLVFHSHAPIYLLSAAERSAAIPEITYGLYGAVLALGTLLGFLLQRQRHDGEHIQGTLFQLEEQSKRLSHANQQVREYANQVFELATAEERNRIAGEIHDVAAHRLTALLVQLQAARRIFANGDDRETLHSNLYVCESLAREALDDIRQSVRSVRKQPTDDGIDVLQRLMDEYGTLTGMDIRLETNMERSSLPARVIAFLYRVIQEGLTNAKRHGKASQVNIRIFRLATMLEVTLMDNGIGAKTPELGFGLTSMQDRIQQAGGQLAIQTSPGQGFTLTLQIPAWHEVAI